MTQNYIKNISEALDVISEEQLFESSLSRINSIINNSEVSQNRNFGTITACRKGQSLQQEKDKNQELKNMIHADGFSTIKLKGRYLESDKYPVKEHSFGVIGKTGSDGGELLTHLKKWATKFEQDSIIHKAHDSKDAVLHSTSTKGNETDLDKEPNRQMNVGQFRANVPNSYGQSGLNHGKLFRFNILKCVIIESTKKDKMSDSNIQVFYIHGFGSSVESNTLELLRESFPDAIGLTYDHKEPKLSIDSMVDDIKSSCRGRDVYVVGSSLGAWFAEQLTDRIVADVVLYNPSISPEISLSKYNVEQSVLYKYKLLARQPQIKNRTVIVSTDDNIINSSNTISKYKDISNVVLTKGGHRMTSSNMKLIVDSINFRKNQLP